MADILVLGATGFAGRLVTRYLYARPDRGSTFTFAIGARSSSKIEDLIAELSLDKTVKVILVDVTKPEQVDEAVKKVKVVINTVGPYIKWGTPVVAACVRHGIHYVDLTGEAHWQQEIIARYDYAASRSGAIIVPASGFDSIPSDIVVHLANKTLKDVGGLDIAIENSTSAVAVKGGFSGGTLSTIFSAIEDTPRAKLEASMKDYALSPVEGLPSPRPRLLYTLPFSSPPIRGGFFLMAASNRAVVQRTWGLHELEARRLSLNMHPNAATKPDRDAQQRLTYGRQFKYDEFMSVKSRAYAVLIGVVFAVGWAVLAFLPPVRWLFKKVVTQPGDGPSDETMAKGFFRHTNITTSVPTDTTPRIIVKTVMNGRGDPGYTATAVMISESALALLLNQDQLPLLGRKGGVLTPMTALGDVLIHRLKQSGRFDFVSEVVDGRGSVEEKKTR